jgi:N,N'-diacetylchitobiose transport system permease protein
VTTSAAPPTTAVPHPRQPGSSGSRRARRPPGRPKRSAATGPARRPWLLLAPTLIVLAVLLGWPLVRVFLISLQDYGLREINTGESNWIGLDNYTALLSDRYLWTTVLPNTVGFAFVTVVLTVTVGTLVALLMVQLGPFWRTVTGVATMVAWAVPAVTGTYVWIFIFDPLDGIGTKALGALGLIEPGVTNVFTERFWFFAIAAMNVVHHGFPFVALTVLAGLLTISKEMQEAATMDGAGPWRRFWSITFPTLRPVFAVVTILSTIWDFKVFTQLYLMPGGDGGNRGVLNLGTWSYIESFAQNQYGLGSAIAVLLTLLLMAITLVYLRVLFKEEAL